ncbi:MAG: ribbon-helix-helix domain-containing protein [Desulfuromonadaceae bacterium]
MGKYKENPMYCVISIRVTDQEKAAMEEISRDTRRSLSELIREAILHYGPYRDVAAGNG